MYYIYLELDSIEPITLYYPIVGDTDNLSLWEKKND